MRIGTMLPSQELGKDPSAIKDYAQGIEELGFDHILITDHVVQAHRDDAVDFAPYTIDDAFQEPMVTLGYLAALTNSIELGTGILILPQRQTVLAAKQAAQADFLSGGRVRLGLGVGWQQMEFDALGATWSGRGKICEEQMEVMRGLWCNDLWSFEGEYHSIPRSGLNPNSVQKPIPLWLGGGADPVAERAGRMADGWMPLGTPDLLAKQFDIMHEAAEAAGRNVSDIGIEAFFGLTSMFDDNILTMDQCMKGVSSWKDRGATHYTFTSMGVGLGSVEDHLKLSAEFKEAAQAL